MRQILYTRTRIFLKFILLITTQTLRASRIHMNKSNIILYFIYAQNDIPNGQAADEAYLLE